MEVVSFVTHAKTSVLFSMNYNMRMDSTHEGGEREREGEREGRREACFNIRAVLFHASHSF